MRNLRTEPPIETTSIPSISKNVSENVFQLRFTTKDTRIAEFLRVDWKMIHHLPEIRRKLNHVDLVVVLLQLLRVAGMKWVCIRDLCQNAVNGILHPLRSLEIVKQFCGS